MDSLTEFLSNVPPQLTVALIHLAPIVAAVRRGAQFMSWKTSWYDSCIALAVWWALCLFAAPVVRFLLPTVVAAVLLALRAYPPRRRPLLVTEHTLQATIADLATIHALLPDPSLPDLRSPPPLALLRAAALLSLPHLLLTHYVPLRVLTALLGSLLFTWRAPWALVLRTVLWRSAWFRWSLYHAWAFLSGQALPPPALSLHPTSTTPAPVTALRFLFTVYENQRWWMGLDWTAALLPGERPSWCTSTQHPVSPPNAFTLPDNTTIYVSDGNGSRIKRTATWSWEEPEWRVLVRKDGGAVSRVERPLPAPKDDSTSSSRLLKAAGRLRDAAPGSNPDPDIHLSEDHPPDTDEEDSITDPDGWVYGDNKWEAQSSRGGMGKYTRYRRWTRIAVVTETVEVVEDGEVGVHRTSPPPPSAESTATVATTPVSTAAPSPPTVDTDSGSDSPLRQRLKKALIKGTAQSQPH